MLPTRRWGQHSELAPQHQRRLSVEEWIRLGSLTETSTRSASWERVRNEKAWFLTAPFLRHRVPAIGNPKSETPPARAASAVRSSPREATLIEKNESRDLDCQLATRLCSAFRSWRAAVSSARGRHQSTHAR